MVEVQKKLQKHDKLAGKWTLLAFERLRVSKVYAVTGNCECTGILGPMLGGGHGVLQGEYLGKLIRERKIPWNLPFGGKAATAGRNAGGHSTDATGKFS